MFLAGVVAAGMTSLRFEQQSGSTSEHVLAERISLALRVSGDSMIEASRSADGDYVVVRRQSASDNRADGRGSDRRG